MYVCVVKSGKLVSIQMDVSMVCVFMKSDGFTSLSRASFYLWVLRVYKELSISHGLEV
jgi:hypothetical protein